jgi:hypothetical protein
MKLSVVLFVAFACGCATTSPPPTIVGAWRGSQHDSQLGTSTETMCFTPDGRILTEAATQAGVLRNRGTYSFDGRKLTVYMPDPGSTTVFDVALRSRRLKLAVAGDAGFVLTRVDEACE